MTDENLDEQTPNIDSAASVLTESAETAVQVDPVAFDEIATSELPATGGDGRNLDLILDVEVRSPQDIENEVGITEGNIFHGELTMDQLLFNRPVPGYAQYRGPVAGMYMCGSSNHPGGGVMGAPGANAAREVLGDLKIAS